MNRTLKREEGVALQITAEFDVGKKWTKMFNNVFCGRLIGLQ